MNQSQGMFGDSVFNKPTFGSQFETLDSKYDNKLDKDRQFKTVFDRLDKLEQEVRVLKLDNMNLQDQLILAHEVLIKPRLGDSHHYQSGCWNPSRGTFRFVMLTLRAAQNGSSVQNHL